jgi:hypothetical protein
MDIRQTVNVRLILRVYRGLRTSRTHDISDAQGDVLTGYGVETNTPFRPVPPYQFSSSVDPLSVTERLADHLPKVFRYSMISIRSSLFSI